MAIYRACYVTREEVRRALDVKQAAYNNTQIDRQIQDASDSVDGLCMRVFFPTDDTRTFDWPNFQFAYPWQLWLSQSELAVSPATLVVTGTYLASPIVIPTTNYILRPAPEMPPSMGPPYRILELRRDLHSAFGGNTTPQNDIGITGTFGYWNKILVSPALLGANINASTTTITTTVGVGGVGAPGAGDMLLIDSERMILQDSQYITTGITFTSGLTSNPPSKADNTIGVPSGPAFTVGEVIVIDSEAMLIDNILGNNLVVERAWDGSALATHSATTIFAQRQWTVTRGDLGTAAASHLQNAVISYLAIPGLVKELAVAEAIVGLTQEPGAYSYTITNTVRGDNTLGGTGHGQQREPMPGAGLPDVRARCFTRYGVKARSQVV